MSASLRRKSPPRPEWRSAALGIPDPSCRAGSRSPSGTSVRSSTRSATSSERRKRATSISGGTRAPPTADRGVKGNKVEHEGAGSRGRNGRFGLQYVDAYYRMTQVCIHVFARIRVTRQKPPESGTEVPMPVLTLAGKGGVGKTLIRPLPLRHIGGRGRRRVLAGCRPEPRRLSLGLPRPNATLSEAVAFGEVGFRLGRRQPGRPRRRSPGSWRASQPGVVAAGRRCYHV